MVLRNEDGTLAMPRRRVLSVAAGAGVAAALGAAAVGSALAPDQSTRWRDGGAAPGTVDGEAVLVRLRDPAPGLLDLFVLALDGAVLAKVTVAGGEVTSASLLVRSRRTRMSV